MECSNFILNVDAVCVHEIMSNFYFMHFESRKCQHLVDIVVVVVVVNNKRRMNHRLLVCSLPFTSHALCCKYLHCKYCTKYSISERV